jgi:hypothetical protein
MDTKKQTRTSRIVGKLLRNRFTAPTEEREQRWLIEEHDDDRYLPPEWHPRGGILSIRKTLRIK